MNALENTSLPQLHNQYAFTKYVTVTNVVLLALAALALFVIAKRYFSKSLPDLKGQTLVASTFQSQDLSLCLSSIDTQLNAYGFSYLPSNKLEPHNFQLLFIDAGSEGMESISKKMAQIQSRVTKTSKPLIVLLLSKSPVTLRYMFDENQEQSLQSQLDETLNAKKLSHFFVAPLLIDPYKLKALPAEIVQQRRSEFQRVQNNPQELAKLIAKIFSENIFLQNR